MTSFDTLPRTLLAAAVADAATYTASYPSGRDSGSYAHNRNHVLMVNGVKHAYPADFTLTFGTANITVTNGSGVTWPVGAAVYLQLDRAGDDDGDVTAVSNRVSVLYPVQIDLGAPDTADIDSIIDAATSTEVPDTETVTYTPDTDGTTPTDGAQGVVVIDGVNYWELDVPRNLTSTVTHGSSVVAMTWVATGLDEFLNVLSETVTVAATGTSQADATLSAFKYVRSIALTAAADAEANTVNIGFGDVLGIPVFLRSIGDVIAELEDNAAPTAGTTVAGVITEPSATTGDVRGTYDPNSACNGALAFSLLCMVNDPGDIGLAPFAG